MTENKNVSVVDVTETPVAIHVHSIRRTLIRLTIVALSITALVGIVSLLIGRFETIQGNIMLTTGAVALFSVSVLCHLAVATRRYRIVSYLGTAFSLAALALGLVIIWAGPELNFESYLNLLGALVVMAFCFAHANLLLVLASHPGRVVKVSLWITISAIGVVAAMLTVLFLRPEFLNFIDPDSFWKLLGVAAILDALGSIVLPIARRFSRVPAVEHVIPA